MVSPTEILSINLIILINFSTYKFITFYHICSFTLFAHSLTLLGLFLVDTKRNNESVHAFNCPVDILIKIRILGLNLGQLI